MEENLNWKSRREGGGNSVSTVIMPFSPLSDLCAAVKTFDIGASVGHCQRGMFFLPSSPIFDTFHKYIQSGDFTSGKGARDSISRSQQSQPGWKCWWSRSIRLNCNHDELFKCCCAPNSV